MPLRKKNSGSKKLTQICSGCKKSMQKDTVYKTCLKCRSRKILAKAKRRNILKCRAIKQDGSHCTYAANKKCGNLYCVKHHRAWLEYINSVDENGIPIIRCSSRTRCDPNKPGEKAILPPNSEYVHCENCRVKNANKDKERKNNKIELGNVNNTRYCKKCPNEMPATEITYIAGGAISPYCKKCFASKQDKESRRAPRDQKEYYREYEKRPETKARRKLWKKNNSDKLFIYYMTYRARQLTNDADKYRARNAQTHRKWVRANPEKAKKIADNVRKNINRHYKTYIYRAERDGIDFEITIGDFLKKVIGRCYYCNVPYKNYPLGLDRIDCEGNYTVDNVVTCCDRCNNMKNTLNEETFILMCAHIAHYNKFRKFKLYPHVFSDYGKKTYLKYKSRATDGNINFDLSREFFYQIINLPCYMCSKPTTENHCNGIDRLNNDKTIGYIESNCKPCCSGCNYMKKDYDWFDVVFKCSVIASHHEHRLDALESEWKPSRYLQENTRKIKLTLTEKAERSELKKRVRNQKTMSTKTQEEIQRRASAIKLAHEMKKRKIIEV